MNSFQFKTSSCHHHGTIKPVQSKTGKHAGKWTCRIKGPSVVTVSAKGKKVNAKTIHSAPYIGAAKAAIAKFLEITVSEVVVEEVVEVVEAGHSSQAHVGGGTSPLPGRQREQMNPPTNIGFDDNDDEFASFDLHAAVSSAKKQSPAPQEQHKYVASAALSPCKSSQEMSSPSNPYRKHQDVIPPTNRVPNSTSFAMSKTKPPRYPQNGGGKLKSTKEKEQKDPDGSRKEADGLREEKERLLKEVSLIKQQKEELENEARNVRNENQRLKEESRLAEQQRDKLKGQARAVREDHGQLKQDLKTTQQQKEVLEKEKRNLQDENQRLRKESKLAEQKRDKLKGQTRAVSEEHDQLKKDLKTTQQQKEQSEEEAKTTCAEKARYEKEARVAKEALDAYKAELDRITKQKKPSAASDHHSSNAAEPPSKKRKAGKQAKNSGTVTKSMTVKDMKEEAVARGMEVKNVATMNKTKLQYVLVIGSTCITKTDTWGQVLLLREKLEKEREQAQEEEARRQQEVWRRQEELDLKKEKEEEKRRAKLKVKREKERASEMSSQVVKHTHHHPTVHGCKLAKTEDLLLHGLPRNRNARCSEGCSYFRDVHYTCEKCDFDICQECFRVKTMTPAEKKKEAKRKAALKKQRKKEQAEMRRLEEKEEEERRKKWDPKQQFNSKIIDPPAKNLNLDGNKKKGFTVWCSDGYGYDGWHSYEGAPNKDFDSTYATKEDANARARYLFHWKNPWGSEPEMIMEEEEVDKSMKDGLVTYVVSPPDSTTWTVSVVPDAAYAYMENSTQHRHGHDGGRSDSESDYGVAF